ncbi:MAG TPA: hypothetical protein VG890_04175 [Puia sp.]|nr:hypothetical protein [Puia sp.]
MLISNIAELVSSRIFRYESLGAPLILLLAGCHKSDSDRLVVTIFIPKDAHTVTPDSGGIGIAEIPDQQFLHLVYLWCKNASTGAYFIHDEQQVYATTYQFSEQFTGKAKLSTE